ncbi:probable protein phosphatase 2C 73 [Aristolochia californica]|uniref:probable protein phosphatase 2C 73 n=1 Tax=Aristolochia californica TaxID=171875 RepID=UPI0035D5F43A
MGACCSKEAGLDGSGKEEEEEKYEEDEGRVGEGGARVRLKGSYPFASMYTQQGRKGINQDAMTIWEDFNGEKSNIFCGVFDGHGPYGHKVARHVRDVLPYKLTQELNPPKPKKSDEDYDDSNEDIEDSDDDDVDVDEDDNGSNCHPFFSSWKGAFVKAYKEMDKELNLDSNFNCYCSGTTAVSVLKQGEDLIIANLGDSRAILCTRDSSNQPTSIQLTVDLKPNVESEAERIESCKGRVFALPEEPDVYRVWLPDDDSPGLAMARAFGDFCLKDYGVISIPQVSYRKLTDKDEFVVLATDGVWDVLSNQEVIDIVASSRKRSKAAKAVVDRAVKSWRSKYPTSKVDDCAVICLFLKGLSSSRRPSFDAKEDSVNKRGSQLSQATQTMENGGSERFDTRDEWTALKGVTRSNSLVKLPRFASALSRRWRSFSAEEGDSLRRISLENPTQM